MDETKGPALGGSRISSLDGLRAISILFVILNHLTVTRDFEAPDALRAVMGVGNLGVRVFFVLSGFLISSLLLKELNDRGTISLARFYYRRTLRIFPPFYLYLLVVAGLLLFDVISTPLARFDLPAIRWWPAITYTSNYVSAVSWYTSHSWSLSVEEQFYLLWPALLLILGKRRALIGAGALLLLAPAIRLGLFSMGTQGIGARFETIADSIATGCLLAGGRGWLNSRTLYRKFIESKIVIAVPFIVVCMDIFVSGRFRWWFVFYIVLGYSIMNLGIAVCIDWILGHRASLVGRVLNSTPLVFIGLISYSIYIWQQLFLNPYWNIRFPLNVIAVFAASVASYYLVERPSLQIRRKLGGRIFSPGKTLEPIIAVVES